MQVWGASAKNPNPACKTPLSVKDEIINIYIPGYFQSSRMETIYCTKASILYFV